MKYCDLVRISRNNYRKNGFIAHVLFFFLALLSSAFLLIGVLWIDAFLIIVPFFVAPTLFSAMIATMLLREQSYMTLKGFFNCFINYYSNKFNSTFRVIRSALFSFVVYISFSIILSLAINLSFYFTNHMGYQDFAAEIMKYTDLTIEGLNALLDKYKDLINYVMIVTSVPSLFVFSISFLFLTSKNSVSLFDRMNTLDINGRINAIVQQNLMKNNFKEYTSAFIKLNWPLFLAFTIGFGCGALIGYRLLETYASVFTIGLSSGVFVAFGLYGPFFLANNEAIYICFKDRYKLEQDKLKQEFTVSIEKIMEEMKKREDETKKDSDES